MEWWWDNWDLSGFVDQVKDAYSSADQNYFGGRLPWGYEPAGGTDPWQLPEPWGNDTPVIGGLNTAWEQAQSPTTDHITSFLGIRDNPFLVPVARGLEIPLNAWNQMSDRVWNPFWGEVMYENPGEVAWREAGSPEYGSYDWQETLGKARPETPEQGLGRLKSGWDVLTGTTEQRQQAMQKWGELSPASKLGGIVLDPTNWIPGLPLGKVKAGAEAAAAAKDITKLGWSERLLSATPKVDDLGKAAALTAEDLVQRKGHPASHLPLVGKAFELTPASRAKELASSTVDQAMSRVMQAADERGVMQVIGDLQAGPMTEGVMERLGPSGASRDALRAGKGLAGYSPKGAIEAFSNAGALQKTVDDLEAAQVAGKLTNPGALDKAKKALEAAPKSLDELKARINDEIIEHAARTSEHAFGVKEGTLDKFVNLQKNILSTMFLGTNIIYPIQNVVSNATVIALQNANPFFRGANKVLAKLGYVKGTAPVMAEKGMGMQGEVRGLASKLPGTVLAQVAERVQSKGVWTQWLDRAFRSYIKPLVDANPLPPLLKQQLASVDPRLPDMVQNAVYSGGYDTKQVIKVLNGMKGFGGTGLPVLDNFLPAALRDDAELMGHLSPMLRELESELPRITDKASKDKVISEFRLRINDYVQALARRSEQAEPMAEALTARGALDLPKRYAEIRSEAFEADRRIFATKGLPVGQRVEQALKVWDDAFTSLRAERKAAEQAFRGALGQDEWRKLDGAYEALEGQTTWYRQQLGRMHETMDATKFMVEKEALSLKYAEATKPADTLIQDLTTDALAKVAFPNGIPANKVKPIEELKAFLHNPVPDENQMLAEVTGRVKELRKNNPKDPEIERAWDAFWAERNKKWKQANETADELRRQTFGDLPAPAQTAEKTAVKAAPAAARPPLGQDYNLYDYARLSKGALMMDALDNIDRGLDDLLTSPVAGEVPYALKRQVINYVVSLQPEFDQARLAAMKIADVNRNFAMLNYSHRYNYDAALATIMPFHFWYTSTMKNMLARYVQQPGLFAAYYRYKKMLNDAEDDPGFPDRLKGLLRINLPFAPEWMGDMFIDPVGKALPLEQAQYLPRMAKWSEEELDPLDVLGAISGITPFLTIPYKLAVEKKPEDVQTLLPASRQLRAASAAWKEAGLPGAENIPAGGWDPEGALRQKVGLPEGDQWTTYRIERMLSNMAGTGEITPEQAKEAMRMQAGPAWETAKQRAAVEQSVSTYTGGALIAKAYPKGEEIQRGLNNEKTALVLSEASKAAGREVTDLTEAWQIVKDAGLTSKGGPIDQFSKANPSLAVREYVSQEPEKRAATDVWDVLNKDSVAGRWVSQHLGAAEQGALTKFYQGDFAAMTPEERDTLQKVMAAIKTARGTTEYQDLQAMSDELTALVDQEFARAGGPEGVTDKYAWLKERNLTKSGTPIANWYGTHEAYNIPSPESAIWDAIEGLPSKYRKQLTTEQQEILQKWYDVKGDSTKMTANEMAAMQQIAERISRWSGSEEYKTTQALSKELGQLIESEFAAAGGPAGVTDKYAWLKEQGLTKKGTAIYQWYQDHPEYTSGTTSGTATGATTAAPKATSGSSSSKSYSSGYSGGYSSKPFTVYPGRELYFFKKWAPQLVKPLEQYLKTGKMTGELAQLLYQLFARNQQVLPGHDFDSWLRALAEQLGIVRSSATWATS